MPHVIAPYKLVAAAVPYIVVCSPCAAQADRRTRIRLEALRFPPISSAKEVTVVFGENYGTAVSLILQSPDRTIIEVDSAVWRNPPESPVRAILYRTSDGAGSAAEFLFTVISSTTRVVSMMPAAGYVFGGTSVTVTLSNFPVVARPEHVTVTETDALPAATV